jgi:hypothetical protein
MFKAALHLIESTERPSRDASRLDTDIDVGCRPPSVQSEATF